jgi:Fe-S-cluster containining protein
MDQQWVNEVRSAALNGELCATVQQLYARLQGEVERRKPICDQSGKCCHFDDYGHRLYVTTIELAAFVRQWRPTAVTIENPRSLPIAPTPSAGGCPFQIDKLCSVHAIRPLGCRIFYCDPTATDWQNEQYEFFHRELKELHHQWDVSYAYLEWREALAALELLSKSVG